MDKIILIEAFKFHGFDSIRVWCEDEEVDITFLNTLVEATPEEQVRLDKYEKMKEGKKVIFMKSLIFN